MNSSQVNSVSNGYQGYASTGGETAQPFDPALCRKDNVINSVVVPTFNDTAPPSDSLGGRIINHLTNTYDFVGTLQQELCDDGRISGQSARELGGVIARTVSSGAILYGTGALAALGAVAAGPVAAIGVVGAGAVALAFGPPAAERAVNWGFDRINDLLGHTKDWVQQQRNY